LYIFSERQQKTVCSYWDDWHENSGVRT